MKGRRADSPAPDVSRPNRPLLGILFMCGASTLFPIMITLVSGLGARYGATQLVWIRQICQLCFLTALFTPRLGLGVFRTRRLGWQIVRSATLLGSTLFLYSGVRFLPVAKSTSISLMGPFFVALFARPILGERLGRARSLAVAIGFAGAFLIIQPTSAMFHPASLLIVGAALCYALFQILTRFVGSHDGPETSAIYSVLCGTLVLSFYMPFAWSPVRGWSDGAVMLLLGSLGGLGHYCVARALIYAQANVVAPFIYWQLVCAVALDYLVKGQLPDLVTASGAAIIVAAGLGLGWQEAREKASAAGPLAGGRGHPAETRASSST